MSWKRLLEERRVEKRSPAKGEITEIREMVKRNLRDASVKALSPEGRFTHAYDAARLLSELAIRCCGYRVRKSGGGHYNTFLAVEVALGKEFKDTVLYFDTCRQKRNEICYDMAFGVSDTEVSELLEKAQEFEQAILSWMEQNHPDLLR